MNSFTSNSKDLFLLIIFCTFLLVSFFYFFALKLTNPKIDLIQNQWQANIIQARQFIYNESIPSTVIVGSSMSFLLRREILEPHIYNLSLAACGPLTGLEIIVKSRFFPDNVLIETNSFMVDLDEELLETLFSPFQYNLKKYLIYAREEFQPINLMISFLKQIVDKNRDIHQEKNGATA